MKKKYEKIGYKWRAGGYGDANTFGEVIATIENKTPEAIVAAAQKKTSPIHDFIFREDDSEAAYKWRIERARKLCRELVTVYQCVETDDLLEVKTLESIPITPDDDDDEEVNYNERVYVDVVASMNDPQVIQQIIDEIVKLQRQAMRKMEELKTVMAKLQ